MHTQSRARTQVRVGALIVSVLASALFTAAVGLRPALDARFGDNVMDLVLDLGLYNLAYVAAACSVLTVRRGVSRRERWGWWALGGALVSTSAGNAWYTLVLVPAGEYPYPSFADYLWLAWYPLGYVAIVFVLTARVGRFPISVWLDGLVAGAGAAAIAAALWFDPLTAQSPGTPALTGRRQHGLPGRRPPARLPARRCCLHRAAAVQWWIADAPRRFRRYRGDRRRLGRPGGGRELRRRWCGRPGLALGRGAAGRCEPASSTGAGVDTLALVTRQSGGSLR